MKSNVDRNLDPLRQSFWRSMLASILICLVASVTVAICKSSVVAGILSYFLLSFITTVLVVYKQLSRVLQELDNS